MKVLASILCFCLAANSANAFLESIWGSSSKAEWNGLRAGFGINPFSSYSFAGLPRTVAEAINSGWKLDTTLGCGKTGTYFNGNRYIKDNDPGAMVLMDKNGYIAGIQAGIPKTPTSLNPNYPKANNMKYKVFNEEPNMWVTTAYFSEPSTICSTGRSESDFNNFGTGHMLSFQVGSSPSDLLHVPMDQKDVVSTTKFVEGNCFVAMGKHFWYDVTLDMSCDDTFPVFLLYNSNRLNGFGWAFNPNYSNSQRWEHPTRTVFGAFMKEVPTCLGKDGPVSTLHVYLTDNPRTGNFC